MVKYLRTSRAGREESFYKPRWSYADGDFNRDERYDRGLHTRCHIYTRHKVRLHTPPTATQTLTARSEFHCPRLA